MLIKSKKKKVEYVNHQGKKFHKQCYNVDVQCGRCNKPVFGEVIQAIDKNWYDDGD